MRSVVSTGGVPEPLQQGCNPLAAPSLLQKFMLESRTSMPSALIQCQSSPRVASLSCASRA